MEELADIIGMILVSYPRLILVAIIIVLAIIYVFMKNNILRKIILIFAALLVLAVIVSILPSFLRPPLSHFSRSEAMRNLGSIFTAQVTYFGEYDTYASSTEQLAWIPEGLKKKRWWQNKWEYSPEGKPRYTYCILEATATQFIAYAEGNIDKDPTLDTWEINEKRRLTNVVNDIQE